tara:strand:- start:259 stop:879 length:621 start_codon:yes stop_codon:yes gene_type:complete
MIKILGEVPKDICIAVSGGIDSMAALDFLRRTRNITVLHYNHGTGEYADNAMNLVKEYCENFSIDYAIAENTETMPKGVSAEAWWREKRYSWFESETDYPIVTAHHLDDVVENWIFTSLNGNPFLIPSKRGQYIRPFLSTSKKDLVDWCVRKNVPYLSDPSNEDTKYRRNYIRHTMMPHVESINPGIQKVIRKKVLERYNLSKNML